MKSGLFDIAFNFKDFYEYFFIRGNSDMLNPTDQVILAFLVILGIFKPGFDIIFSWAD